MFAANNRDPVATAAEDLAGYVRSSDSQFTETVPNPDAADRRYAVVALSRLGARSEPSEVVRVTATGRDNPFVPTTPLLEIAAVWPQPARSLVNVQIGATAGSDARVSIVDVTGRIVRSKRSPLYGSGSVTETFDVSMLASGVYVLIVQTEAGVRSQRLVVTR